LGDGDDIVFGIAAKLETTAAEIGCDVAGQHHAAFESFELSSSAMIA
jgi:hypothetical protein